MQKLRFMRTNRCCSCGAMLMTIARSALAYGGAYGVRYASAFAGMPTLAEANRSLRARGSSKLVLSGGGLEGTAPGLCGRGIPPSGGAAEDGEGSSQYGQTGIEDDEEPFPIWRGMTAYEMGEAEAPAAGVIVVDPFCEYLGKRCVKILEEAGYGVVQVLCEHLVATLDAEGADRYGPPRAGEEAAWAACLPFPVLAVLCESDAGLATAGTCQPDERALLFEILKRLQAALLGPRFGGVNEARRDKFLMNEALRGTGLATARQVKTGDWSEAREFLSTLGAARDTSSARRRGDRQRGTGVEISPGRAAGGEGRGGDESLLDGVDAIVKPLRGCASGSVFRCRGEQEAKEAFEKILGTPKYGTPGAFNDEVLIQEFLEGTEWVVDTVSRDGKHKAVAIWRYDKRPVNGAAFVYFSTQLMPYDTEEAQRVVEYAFQALDAVGVKFGPTHTEVMMVRGGRVTHEDREEAAAAQTPMLVEVNTRWHLTDFAPLTDICVGYNAVEETLSAYLDPQRFDELPQAPPPPREDEGRAHGRVVHLVSYVEGTLERIRYEQEIESMDSFAGMDVYADPARGGSGQVKKTIDIRSDAGWVRLIHKRPEIVERDFQRVVNLMPTMFDVSAPRQT